MSGSPAPTEGSAVLNVQGEAGRIRALLSRILIEGAHYLPLYCPTLSGVVPSLAASHRFGWEELLNCHFLIAKAHFNSSIVEPDLLRVAQNFFGTPYTVNLTVWPLPVIE